MAALAADINVSTVGTPTLYKFAANGADTYYRGAIVFIDTGGGVQVVPAAGDLPLGISTKQQVIAAAADLVEVMVEGWAWLPIGTGVAADDEGTRLTLDISATQSDNAADWIPEADAGGGLAANDISLGIIKKVETTRMLIKFAPAIHNGTTWVEC